MNENSDGNGLEQDDKAEKVRELNDRFRRTFVGGTVLLTRGVDALENDIKRRVLVAIREFDNFVGDNDPYGTHEFGGVEIDGTRVWFKVDCYDRNHEYGSPDPSGSVPTFASASGS